MSEYHISTKPRLPPPVYRCGNHWHFHPVPESTWFNPLPPNLWYLDLKPFEEQEAIGPIYAHGAGNSPYHIDDLFESGFCSIYKEGQEREWCTGRYGKRERPLWRMEEVSKTPWVSGRPPSYQAASSMSSAAAGKDGELPAYEEGDGIKGKGNGDGKGSAKKKGGE